MPVDPVQLVTVLDAYDNIYGQVHTLRLCHRFRLGPLSRLPQEVLDMIISRTLHMLAKECRDTYHRQFACFQGRCQPAEHYGPYDFVLRSTWKEIFGPELNAAD